MADTCPRCLRRPAACHTPGCRGFGLCESCHGPLQWTPAKEPSPARKIADPAPGPAASITAGGDAREGTRTLRRRARIISWAFAVTTAVGIVQAVAALFGPATVPAWLPALYAATTLGWALVALLCAGTAQLWHQAWLAEKDTHHTGGGAVDSPRT